MVEREPCSAKYTQVESREEMKLEADLSFWADALVRGSARGALMFYALALLMHFWGFSSRNVRMVWTAGFLTFLIHLAAAFHFVHGWSHASAYEETARRTHAVIGTAWGGGIYFNHVFALLWGIDVLWWWLCPVAYQHRARWIGVAIHSYLAFIAFNSTVVFGPGWIRWAGAFATVVIVVFAWRAGIKSPSNI